LSKNLIKERLGNTNKNKFGSIMKIVEYKGTDDIWVQFENGNKVHTTWKAFCKGDVKNVYDKSVYGTGYIGEGGYKTKINSKHTVQYSIWHGMLKRCYYEKDLMRNPTYRECSITEEWLNFQNFAKWYDENYYEIDGSKMELDKDILVKGNKVYSPETCLFVPKNINMLFIKGNAKRGNLPIGVCLDKARNKYIASCNFGNIKLLSRHSTPEEAFEVYREHKEKFIKQIADDYKNKIPAKVYNALLNYKVEITD
jgi:hypothetical protein